MVSAARSLILLGAIGCEEPRVTLVSPAPSDDVEPPGWADVVMDAPGADPTIAFGDPELAANGARGVSGGGTDVYSLTSDDERPYLTLGFSNRVVLDAPGVVLVVFENPFGITGGGRFMDQIIVSVSPDGVDFISFPNTYGLDEYSREPSDWVGFAGVTPALRNEDARSSPAADDPASGGDRFDLADLPAGDLRDQVLSSGAIAVRMTSVALHDDPITERPYPIDPASNGPDIDAVYAWTFGTR